MSLFHGSPISSDRPLKVGVWVAFGCKARSGLPILFLSPHPEGTRALWLTRVKLSGIRVEKIKAPPEKFEFHDTDTDVIVIQDPTAPSLWARHLARDVPQERLSGVAEAPASVAD